ncbi:hypothetical protein [Arthrobacter sp. TWP1-1]|uniref:hypothetical protein n=1 Tax=Arthrobacter sp. TWP1-1 TaxID=2804568 RepID=UPI003CF90917
MTQLANDGTGLTGDTRAEEFSVDDAEPSNHVQLFSNFSGSGTLSAELYVEYVDRRWSEMWFYVQRAHKILCATASTVPANHLDLRADAMTFFILCSHLYDWVKADLAVEDLVKDLRTEIAKSPALRICLEAANTSKHAGRDDGKLDVQIRKVSFRPNDRTRTMETKVEYIENGVPQSWDVLDLADKCLAWWKNYLKDNGLAE